MDDTIATENGTLIRIGTDPEEALLYIVMRLGSEGEEVALELCGEEHNAGGDKDHPCEDEEQVVCKGRERKETRRPSQAEDQGC